MTREKKYACGLVLFILVAACSKTPVTGREAFILTTEKEESELGEKAYAQVLHKEKTSNDKAMTELLQRVGERIAVAAHAPSYKWEFRLIESKEKNAFCLPGGKVAVYTGIFSLMDNEAQLAAVIGHEAGHATARHAGQRITLQFGEEITFAALASAMGESNSKEKTFLFQALGLGAVIGTVLPFTRAQESEADYIGEIYMAKAGYDPRESIHLWENFAARSPKSPPEILSDHPSYSNRSKTLTDHLPEVLEVYKASPNYGLGQMIRHSLLNQ